MKLDEIKAGPLSSNSYFLIEGNECIVIDCGGDETVTYLETNGLKPVAVFLTHGHFDHTLGVEALREKFGDIPVYALDEEKDVCEDYKNDCSDGYFDRLYKVMGITYKKDGDIVNVLGYDIKFIHTPGHTKGGCCFYIEKEKALFSGDTLFKDTWGRTDLPTGDIRKLVVSVGRTLMALPDDTKVYPGHSASTTIGYERENNEIVKTYNMRKSWD